MTVHDTRNGCYQLTDCGENKTKRDRKDCVVISEHAEWIDSAYQGDIGLDSVRTRC